MNFTPLTLAYISEWSRENDVFVDVSMVFEGPSYMYLVFRFTQPSTAKVWNKRYDKAFFDEYSSLKMHDLVTMTLHEAKKYFS